VQLTDNREAEQIGWTLTAQLSEHFTSKDETLDQLRGATDSFVKARDEKQFNTKTPKK
jgi:hypothetical protein